jgi:hypothetical protein
VMYGATFTDATQYLTPAVVKYKNLETKWSIGSINHNKITSKLQTRFCNRVSSVPLKKHVKGLVCPNTLTIQSLKQHVSKFKPIFMKKFENVCYK